MDHIRKRKWLEVAILFHLDHLVRPIGFRSFCGDGITYFYNPTARSYKKEAERCIYFFFDNPLSDEFLKVHIDKVIVDDVVAYFKEDLARAKSRIEWAQKAKGYYVTYADSVEFIKKEIDLND